MNARTQRQPMSTRTLVLGAILTALVMVLQFMGSFIHLGPFSISLVLLPIVIGAATCGTGIGTWLGLVFGVVVLLSGDAAAFLAIDVPATVVIVLCKGLACGWVAGLVYHLLAKKNRTFAVFMAAIVCPMVNTGIFLLGSGLFFLDDLRSWALADGYGNVLQYMFLGLAGGNFLVELGSNLLLSPIIVRILDQRK